MARARALMVEDNELDSREVHLDFGEFEQTCCEEGRRMIGEIKVDRELARNLLSFGAGHRTISIFRASEFPVWICDSYNFIVVVLRHCDWSIHNDVV